MNLKINVIAMTLTACATVATLFAQEPTRRELSEGWTFQQARGNNVYPATVPGVVQSDLLDNKLIEDPHFRLNERSIQWVDKEDWIYRTSFSVDPATLSRSHVELHFKGLDTYADVFLNDSLILSADNMFREWRVEVKHLLKPADNQLRVYFHSPIKVDVPKFDALHYPIEAGNDQAENGGLFNKKVSVFARKAGYHYGWDWGPRIVTSGIWRPIDLVAWDDFRIDNIHYRQEKVSAKRADLRVLAEVTAAADGPATLSVRAAGLPGQWKKEALLTKGKNLVEIELSVKNPKLWWSNGLGEPHLYPFTATLADANGKVFDRKEDNIGIRSLRVVNEPDAAGHTFYFELNGVPVFAKGANYIPQHNFLPSVTPDDYERTILDAVRANMNMLRVWGGGIYEEDIFFDLCDRHGILVWQDFAFACSTYPMTPELLESIRLEARDNIIRLRNHPSLAIWCGNNEMHTAWFNWGWMRKYQQLGVLEELRKDYKDLFHGVLAEAVEAYDPLTFYWPSSPYGGNPDARTESGRANWNPDGDGHYWGVWHARDSIANYNKVRARFFSEYGFQSFPEYQSVLRYAPEERDHDIYSDVMMAHQRGGAHANGLIEWYLLNEYRKPKDFPTLLFMGQILQGDAIRTAIEAHRRDMPYCMGTLFWQHNDCWPVASWSSRDYYGRWKAQHYFARKAFDDILVSPILHGDTLDIFVVSDRLKPTRGTLEATVMDFHGNIISEHRRTISAPANTSRMQLTAPLAEWLDGRSRNEVFVHVRFIADDNRIYTNNYFLARQKDIDFPVPKISAVSAPAEGGIRLLVESDTFARGVFLSIDGTDNFFSDNYFDLLPGKPVAIHVTTSLDLATFERQLKIVSLAEAY